ncbi:MAG: nitroreductase [Acidimicrobiia bacterium]|nr:nitroreductase [Acidimicrobiia bacterium]
MNLEAALALLKGRRTNLRMDPERAVPDSLIATLCEVAVWAPNHKLTEPWRFAAITGDARKDLGELAARVLVDGGVTDPARLQKARVKYLRAPVMLVVACAPDPDPVRHAEDLAAVAAGTQNLLLAATSAGLASYWGTGLTARSVEMLAFCDFEAGSEIVAMVYLGWPTSEAPPTGRRPPVVTWVKD